ncbi:MAG TPA: hypothetical protein PLD49_00655 [Thermoclostridium caenicola]|uniref:Nitrogen regulatory protein P-II family n=1 Tax=Thermoclostridium caenicola TaxID=659425 RepID=A0A1M6DXL6_9FIRM|nr:hypothetical protein [Thermoclostridium caenicola]SHI77905.1 hypothetical protein SAMN05444373_100933 [Thermoclostridium caenicola]HOK42165.1 hypothetical protein [Thermoclostridium caenicola]HOL84246.1 hypothetical protein [Thermoclostridium caenicola]HOP72254.1 hypothetical protein [Thermoclostridium caenicola]HPO75676.1 hypothetical protein [Thermoclostridium caenicola]
MKLFVLILNRTEKLDELMLTYAREKICGATIIDSTGMARELASAEHHEEEISFLGSIRKYLNGSLDKRSKTILVVIRDDQQEKIIRLTEEVVGDFSRPDTGIMFTLPLDFVQGKGLDK